MAPRPPTVGGPARRRETAIRSARDGQVTHFNGLLIGKDGKVAQAAPAPATQRPRMARLQARRPMAARCCPALIDAHGPHHGPGLRAHPCRSLRDDQSSPTRRPRMAALCRRPSQSGPGSRASAGTRRDVGISAASRPRPTIDAGGARPPPWCSSASMAMRWVANSAAMAAAGHLGRHQGTSPGGHIRARPRMADPRACFVDAARAR